MLDYSIGHYGLLANSVRRASLAKVRELLDAVPEVTTQPDDPEVAVATVFVCRHCGAPMIVIEILKCGDGSKLRQTADRDNAGSTLPRVTGIQLRAPLLR